MSETDFLEEKTKKMTIEDIAESSIFDLKTPNICEGEEISLRITLAGNPTNFTFQLTMFDNDRQQQEFAMAEFYEANEKYQLKNALRKTITKNHVYAVHGEDGVWYRAVALKGELDEANRALLRLIDYGECVIVDVSTVRELAPEFRKLPFMASMGKLAGVWPNAPNWTREDCERFQQLVYDRLLTGTVCAIMDSSPWGDSDSPMDRTALLNLQFESNGQVMDIAQIMESEGLAKRDG